MKANSIPKPFICAVVASPTSILNAVASMGNPDCTIDNFYKDPCRNDHLAYSAWTFFASMFTFTYLNTLYLYPSVEKSLEIFNLRKKSGCCEVSLFIWSLATSFIFAEMGAKALEPVGNTAKYIGFSLNLIVYFATRFCSAAHYFSKKNNKKYHHIIRQLWSQNLNLTIYIPKFNKCADLDNHIPLLSAPDDTSNIPGTNLIMILNNGTGEFISLGDNKNSERQNEVIMPTYIKAAPWVGYALALFGAVATMIAYTTVAVEGIEDLTNSDFGKKYNYQNIASILLGAASTLLTGIFYAIAIKDLPDNLLRTIRSIYYELKNNGWSSNKPWKLLTQTLAAAYASYLSSIGFESVAREEYKKGHYNYSQLPPGNDQIPSLVPDFLIISVTCMLWSHLQGLINKDYLETVIRDETVTQEENGSMTIANAIKKRAEWLPQDTGTKKNIWCSITVTLSCCQKKETAANCQIFNV